jgi:hydroxypyruvate isomerase
VPRFSANLGFLFTEVPFLDRFAAAAAAGFHAVEFPDPHSHDLDAVAALLRQHALSCVLVNMPLGDRARGERGLACLPGRAPEFREGVARAIAAARALGCPRVNCMAGRAPAGADPRALGATLVENLKYAAQELARAELTVCLEPLSTLDTPDLFLTGTRQAVEVIRDVAEDNVRLQLDCYHMHLMEGGLAASLARLLPLVEHVQIADAPGRHEPGSGEIDYPALFAELDRLGYAGWVGAEYHPTRRTEETLGWMGIRS